MKLATVLIAIALGGHSMGAIGAPPLRTSQEAIAYVLKSSDVQFSENARLVSLSERQNRGLSWHMNLRDGDILYIFRVTSRRKLTLVSKQSDPKFNNVEFWAAQPLPGELPIASTFLPRAQQVLESFNSNFKGDTKRYQIIYSVCKPRKITRKPAKPASCQSVYIPKNTWRTRMQIDLPHGKKKVKEVVFEQDQAVEIRTVLSYGRWQF